MNSSALSTEAQRTISNAIVAAFRTFLNPDAVQKVQAVLERELGVTHDPSSHNPTAVAYSPGPANPAAAANGKNGAKGGKRKREDKLDRKPRPISLFNLFQAKVTRMVKESGELDKNQRLLTVTSGLWKTTEDPFKEKFKKFYMPLLDKFNEAKQSGGSKMDLHHDLMEFEKVNPPPPELVGIIDKLVSNTCPLPPVSPRGNGPPQSPAGNGTVVVSQPAEPVVNGTVETHEAEGGSGEVDGEREAKTPTEQPRKKKKKKSKEDGQTDAEQTPAAGTDKKKKKDKEKKDTEKKKKSEKKRKTPGRTE